jgi:hypothetical protein
MVVDNGSLRFPGVFIEVVLHLRYNKKIEVANPDDPS